MIDLRLINKNKSFSKSLLLNLSKVIKLKEKLFKDFSEESGGNG